MKNLQFLIIAFLVLGPWFLVNPANSQSRPELFVSWKAENFAPSDYQGKILPVRESVINVSFDLIDNGRTTNISRNEIQWKSGGKILNSGLGLKNNSFRVSKLNSGDLTIAITVFNYGGRDIQETVTIPVAEPEVVIDQIGTNSFAAKPYFFNVAGLGELKFEWSVNGEQPQGLPEDPNILTVENIDTSAEIPINLELNLEVDVVNLLNQLERALGRLTINL